MQQLLGQPLFDERGGDAGVVGERLRVGPSADPRGESSSRACNFRVPAPQPLTALPGIAAGAAVAAVKSPCFHAPPFSGW